MQKNQQACLLPKQGFTLVEVLVVIAIIGILASASAVSTNNARSKADKVARRSTLASIKNGIAACCYGSNGSLQTVPGNNICDPPVGVILPTAAMLGPGITYLRYSLDAHTDVCRSNDPRLFVFMDSLNCHDPGLAFRVRAGDLTELVGMVINSNCDL